MIVELHMSSERSLSIFVDIFIVFIMVADIHQMMFYKLVSWTPFDNQ